MTYLKDAAIIKAPNGTPLARVTQNCEALLNAAVDAKLEDKTRRFEPNVTNPKFTIDKNYEGRFVVSLIARNGKTVAEFLACYAQKASALNGIKCMKRMAEAALRQK